MHKHGPDKVLERIAEVVKGRQCYVTFDVDSLDPAFAPGTGTPVAGTLTLSSTLVFCTSSLKPFLQEVSAQLKRLQ